MSKMSILGWADIAEQKATKASCEKYSKEHKNCWKKFLDTHDVVGFVETPGHPTMVDEKGDTYIVTSKPKFVPVWRKKHDPQRAKAIQIANAINGVGNPKHRGKTEPAHMTMRAKMAGVIKNLTHGLKPDMSANIPTEEGV